MEELSNKIYTELQNPLDMHFFIIHFFMTKVDMENVEDYKKKGNIYNKIEFIINEKKNEENQSQLFEIYDIHYETRGKDGSFILLIFRQLQQIQDYEEIEQIIKIDIQKMLKAKTVQAYRPINMQNSDSDSQEIQNPLQQNNDSGDLKQMIDQLDVDSFEKDL